VSEAEIYDGVNQRRTLVWLKPSGALVVLDELTAKADETFDQIFHGLGELSVDGRRFLFRGDELSLAGSVLQPRESDLLAIAKPERATGPRAYCVVRIRGASVRFLTLLEPFEGEPPPPRQLDESGELTVDLEEGALRLACGDDGVAIRLNDERLV
jgi:hypothetical protein